MLKYNSIFFSSSDLNRPKVGTEPEDWDSGVRWYAFQKKEHIQTYSLSVTMTQFLWASQI